MYDDSRQHYPGTTSPEDARSINKTLWASEEFANNNTLPGGGCWARVIRNLLTFCLFLSDAKYQYGALPVLLFPRVSVSSNYISEFKQYVWLFVLGA